MGYNSACVEISTRCLSPVRGFRDRAIEWCQSNSATTDPVAMATKFQTKSVITGLACQISPRSLRLTGLFCVKISKMSVEFYNDRHWLPWQRHWQDKTGYSSVWIGYIAETLARIREFSGSGYTE